MHQRKSIARNRKKLIERIRSKAYNIRSYNKMSGEMDSLSILDFCIDELFKYKQGRMNISDEGFGTISIHSNNFTNFQIPDDLIVEIFGYNGK